MQIGRDLAAKLRARHHACHQRSQDRHRQWIHLQLNARDGSRGLGGRVGCRTGRRRAGALIREFEMGRRCGRLLRGIRNRIGLHSPARDRSRSRNFGGRTLWSCAHGDRQRFDAPPLIGGHVVQVNAAVSDFQRQRRAAARRVAVEARQKHVFGVASVGSQLQAKLWLRDSQRAQVVRMGSQLPERPLAPDRRRGEQQVALGVADLHVAEFDGRKPAIRRAAGANRAVDAGQRMTQRPIGQRSERNNQRRKPNECQQADRHNYPPPPTMWLANLSDLGLRPGRICARRTFGCSGRHRPSLESHSHRNLRLHSCLIGRPSRQIPHLRQRFARNSTNEREQLNLGNSRKSGSGERRGVSPTCQGRASGAKSLANRIRRRQKRPKPCRKREVRARGFEPPRYCYRQPLKLVRLPVPPRSRA